MDWLRASGGFAELVVDRAANLLGTQPDHVRLFMAILAGFPCALLYRYVISHFTPALCHIYFFLCGLGLIAWNVGSNVIHSLINTSIVYLVLRFVKNPNIYIPLIFILNMTYLFIGYLMVSTREYVVNWTMPHCVLCLRLIGLAFDIADGRKYESLSEEQRETALRERPSALETFSYAYFFGGSLVGPQFPFKRYLDFVNGNLIPAQLSSYTPDCVLVALGRFCVSIICIALFEITNLVFFQEYLLSEAFQEWNFAVRALYITIWGYNLLHKYLSVWLMSEGVCTACGLSYSGPSAAAVQAELDRSGRAGLDALVARWKAASNGERKDWFSACSNVHFRKFEFGASGVDVIGSFNLTTNRWAARYVYRRLRFLGSRSISHVLTLFFLAVWHGSYSGYFICFASEFFVVVAERTFGELVNLHCPKLIPAIEKSGKAVRFSVWLARKLLFQFAASFSLVAFALLEFKVWYSVYTNMHFSGLFHVPVLAVLTLVRFLLPKRRRKEINAAAKAE